MQGFTDRFFKDKNGRIVIFQIPNIYIWLWLILFLASKAVQDDTLKDWLQLFSGTALFYWAMKEIFQGVNYFRKLLGVVVAIAVSLSVFRLFGGS